MAYQVVDDLGFAEFVAKLVAETFDSVLANQIEQEQRSADLVGLANMGLSEASALLVTQEERSKAKLSLGISDADGNPLTDDELDEDQHKILDEELEKLALPRLRGVQALVEQGIPRVLVDHGHIKAKMSFTIADSETEVEDAEGTIAALLSQYPALYRQRVLPKTRLTVRQASQGTEASIFGEVEIHFKTVI